MNILDFPDPPDHPKRLTDAFAAHEKMQAVSKLAAMHGPLRQFEEMQRYLNPLRQWEEMQRQLDPFRESKLQQMIPDALRGLDSLRFTAGIQAQRMLEQFAPASHADLSLSKIHEQLRLNVLGDGFAERERIESITRNQHWLNDFSRHATGGILAQELARQFEYANPTLTAIAEAQKTFDKLAASFQHIDLSSYSWNEDDEREAEEEVEALTEAASAETTLAALVAQFAAAIEAQQNPTVKLRIWVLLTWFLNTMATAYISAIMAQQFPAPAPDNEAESVKSIKVAVRNAAGSSELLTEYRFVSAHVVVVRQNPRARSPKLAELRFGSAVRVLRKDKDFVLIAWMDQSSGAEIHGWVFARYLQKFS